MPVLATFTNVTALSIGANTAGCLAHSLPTQPDWAVYQPTATFGALVALVTRAAAGLWWHNSSGSATPGESIAQFVHSIQR